MIDHRKLLSLSYDRYFLHEDKIHFPVLRLLVYRKMPKEDLVRRKRFIILLPLGCSYKEWKGTDCQVKDIISCLIHTAITSFPSAVWTGDPWPFDRFFSFMEFSVIYWIRNNFPFLCDLLLLREWRSCPKERNESLKSWSWQKIRVWSLLLR